MNIRQYFFDHGIVRTIQFLWQQICGLQTTVAANQAAAPILTTFTGTGNGVTTVFTFAHGLGHAPTFLTVQGNNTLTNSQTFTVTSNATDIIITYGTAPAAGALQWTALYH